MKTDEDESSDQLYSPVICDGWWN